LHKAVQLAADDKFQLPMQDQNAESMRQEIRAGARRRDYAILSAALSLGGILWFALVREPHLPGTWPGTWPGAVCLAAGLGVFFFSRR
jgi:hypothetical protein